MGPWGLPYGARLGRSRVFDSSRAREIPLLVDRPLRDTAPRPIADKCVDEQSRASIPGQAPNPPLANNGSADRKAISPHPS